MVKEVRLEMANSENQESIGKEAKRKEKKDEKRLPGVQACHRHLQRKLFDTWFSNFSEKVFFGKAQDGFKVVFRRFWKFEFPTIFTAHNRPILGHISPYV